MFQKLRNRFLLLNLTTIVIVMLIAFGSIYVITYQNVQSDIALELGRVSDFHERPQTGAGPPQEGPSEQRPGGGPMGGGQPPVDRAVTFMLRVDAAWAIIENDSKFTLTDAFYEEALEAVADEGKHSGQLTLDGSDWAYLVTPEGSGKVVVFLDITARQSILNNLIYAFGVVAAVTLVALYAVSRYFANRSIRPVQEAFDKQKQFIADASHELKTPLTIIHTNADVLLSGGAETARDQAKWLGYIKSETERMTKLTNDLLYLTEIDDHRTQAVYARFAVSEAVESMLLTMEAVLFEKKVELAYELDPDLLVHGSAEQIKQVVMILLDNAAKYTPMGGSVSLMLKKTQQEAMLTVDNTGEGISPEHLPHLFDRFYRTEASRVREQGGYGLGLAIAKSIIEQHRGRITVRSVPHVSTTFTVYLPLVPAQDGGRRKS